MSKRKILLEHFFWGKLFKEEISLGTDFGIIARTDKLTNEMARQIIREVWLGRLPESDELAHAHSLIQLKDGNFVVSRYQLIDKIDRSRRIVHSHHVLVAQPVMMEIGCFVEPIIQQSLLDYEKLPTPEATNENLPPLEVFPPEALYSTYKDKLQQISSSRWSILDTIWRSGLEKNTMVYSPQLTTKQKLSVVTDLQYLFPLTYRLSLTYATTVTDPQKCNARIMFVIDRSHKDLIELAEFDNEAQSEKKFSSYYLRWVHNKVVSKPDQCIDEIENLNHVETTEGFESLSLSQKLDRLAEYADSISTYLKEPFSQEMIVGMSDEKLWHILSFVDLFIQNAQERSSILTKFIVPQIEVASHSRALEMLTKTYVKWFSIQDDRIYFVKQLINQFLTKKLENFTDFLTHCYARKENRELETLVELIVVLYLQNIISRRDYESASRFFQLMVKKNHEHEKIINRAVEQIIKLPSPYLITIVAFLAELKGFNVIRLLSGNKIIRQGISSKLLFTGQLLKLISTMVVQNYNYVDILIKSYQEIDNRLWFLYSVQAVLTDEENLGWQFISKEVLDEIHKCIIVGNYNNELQRLWRLVRLSYKKNLENISSQVTFGLYRWAVINVDIETAMYLYLHRDYSITRVNLKNYFLLNQYEEALLKSVAPAGHIEYELQKLASLKNMLHDYERYYWCQGAARLLFVYKYSSRFDVICASLIDYLANDFANSEDINWLVPPVGYVAMNGGYDEKKISPLIERILYFLLQYFEINDFKFFAHMLKDSVLQPLYLGHLFNLSVIVAHPKNRNLHIITNELRKNELWNEYFILVISWMMNYSSMDKYYVFGFILLLGAIQKHYDYFLLFEDESISWITSRKVRKSTNKLSQAIVNLGYREHVEQCLHWVQSNLIDEDVTLWQRIFKNDFPILLENYLSKLVKGWR